ncbi:cytochrome d ubiquinol oxidase subunit II [Segetibacter koreensis]|uniref:cytochrome d ubiquinol oxidase subunit II n=1 Tax=Segetibacter koreensis TaxID=398037 RepID=UPI00039CC19B|nr:cytochrome d ubiquinol oxidase subunit II [Segetibacter koreensis]
MLALIILILGTSFVLYTLLGGADFGAGIIEIFAGKREEKTITRAIAPVWEANHVWLILAVVILFTGFPLVYSSLSLVLHIPLMLVLIGIIFRGSAFTFRHYDVSYGRSHRYYTFLFKASSFITPMFLGITLGAMILGRITFNQSVGFYEMFVSPWLNVFCFIMGVFSTSLFAYIAAVFLIPEAHEDKEKNKYTRLARNTMASTITSGILVFIAAQWEGHNLVSDFLKSPISIISLAVVALLVPVILHFIHTKKAVYLRASIGLQVTAIVTGWFAIQYPVVINVKDGHHLTFFNTHAPDATLKQLLIALMVGLVLVIPAFIFLFRVFKVKE